MDAQCAATPFHQHLKVAARLRRFHHAEAVGMAGHVDISRIVASDLQEHAGIGAALVGLAGRMLKAGSEAEASGGMSPVANARAHRGQRLRVGLVALDVRQQRHVVTRFYAGVRAPEMTLKIAGQRVVLAEHDGVAWISKNGYAALTEYWRLLG